MTTTNNEVLRGRINKAGNVELEVDVADINWRRPISISSKGNASYVFSQKFEFEIEDQDGITVPVTVSVGVYLTKKDFKDYMDQVAGHNEGKVARTNVANTTTSTKYTLEQLELLQSKGLLKPEMVQALLEKGLVEL